MGHPKRQKPQDAASLLKARQRLPLALEHGKQRGMERIARSKCILRVVCREPVGELGAVIEDKISVLLRSLPSIFGKSAPFEQTTAYDLRRFGLSRHDHRLAQSIQ